MEKATRLNEKQLRRDVNEAKLGFETTNELEPLAEFIGQARALEAATFGASIQTNGYNLFAMGKPGTGKHSIIKAILEKEASEKAVPSDWCYIHNFESPQKPIALQLPPGLGLVLRQDMELLVNDLKTTIPAIFESEEFRNRIQKISEETQLKQENLFKTIVKEGKQQGLLIFSTHEGFSVLPLNEKNTVMTQEEFDALPEPEKKHRQSLILLFTHQLTDFIKQIPLLQKERSEKEKEIQKEFTLAAVGHFMDDLKKKYEIFSDLLTYLEAVEQDVIINVKDFIKREEVAVGHQLLTPEMPSLSRYCINLLVSHANTKGAPILFAENPTYSNLICRLDHEAYFGSLVTDFTLIKPGALHQANGGYLMIEADKLLTQPYAWEGLKRALYDHQIAIEPMENMMGLFRTTSLEPIPIPLNIKVVLLGERLIFNLLQTWDPDFSELFKVAVDFQDRMDWSKKNLDLYSRFIAAIVRKENLLPFHRSAVALLIEQSSRMTEDAEKLSVCMRNIRDLMCEADYWANLAKKKSVEHFDIKQAMDAKIRRMNRMQEEYYEEIQKNIILINTSDEVVGQINGLVLFESGDYAFGYPVRITANVRFGSGEVIDIQREVKLSGPIHAKGVLILSSFLTGRYSRDTPFSLSASIAFEQTYGTVEGDSASVAELCVLLSAISEFPIKQCLAVTGSINQHGEVQAVGGINEKIEGFYDICKFKGFNGKQGVLIPASNVKHLMLREEVVEAVKKKVFSIYAIKTIDQAISILTGVKAGKRSHQGKFPEGCVNFHIEKCLQQFSKKRNALKERLAGDKNV